MSTLNSTVIGLTAFALVTLGSPDPASAQIGAGAYRWANECRDDWGTRTAQRNYEREHREVHRDLDRIHARWHREYDHHRRAKRWKREHKELHRYLEREHAQWHRSSRVRMDRYQYRHRGDGRSADLEQWRDYDWDDDRYDDRDRYDDYRDRDDDWDDDRYDDRRGVVNAKYDRDDRYGKKNKRSKKNDRYRGNRGRGNGRGPACGPVSRSGRVYRNERGGRTWVQLLGGIRVEIPWP